jgi:hypothetical protein
VNLEAVLVADVYQGRSVGWRGMKLGESRDWWMGVELRKTVVILEKIKK